MEVSRKRNKRELNLRLTCTKFILFLLNVVFLFAGVLMVSTEMLTDVALTSYAPYVTMRYGLNTFLTMWLVVGIIASIVASFGIFAALKESTALTNVYGITMMVVFVLQVAVTIYSFTLMNQTQVMVTNELKRLILDYSDGYQLDADWIQSKFQCCGISGPNDWDNFGIFLIPHLQLGNKYIPLNEVQLKEATDLMPVSCCEKFGNYVNLKCERFHNTGCFEPIHQIVSGSVMLIVTSSLILSILQLLCVFLGFYYARIVRRWKTERDMDIWNQGNPIFVARQPKDYSPIHWYN